METTVKERLRNFIEYKGITVSRFEKNCGLSNGYMKSLRSNPGLEKLSDILRSYPDPSQFPGAEEYGVVNKNLLPS